jgi:hypothetical protein
MRLRFLFLGFETKGQSIALITRKLENRLVAPAAQ